MKNPIFFRLHTGYKHPELILHLFRSRTTIFKKLVKIHIEDVRSKWNPKYKKLKPLSMFRKAIIISENRYLKNKYLYHIVRYLEPEIIIETGVHYGISTTFMLAALHDNDNGVLYSIDLPEKDYQTDICNITQRLPKQCETGFLIPDKLKDRWILSIGDAKELLEPLCRKLTPVDIFHHDSEHTYKHMTWEFQTAWPHLKKGGLILTDDWDYNEAPIHFGIQKCKEGTGDFNMYMTRGCVLKK